MTAKMMLSAVNKYVNRTTNWVCADCVVFLRVAGVFLALLAGARFAVAAIWPYLVTLIVLPCSAAGALTMIRPLASLAIL
jgi:hypothetical protein